MSNFDPFLNTAETLAHFQSTGTFPDDRERLNKWAKLPLMAGAAVFKSLAGMLSRPVALVVLRPLSSLRTSSDVMAENLNFW